MPQADRVAQWASLVQISTLDIWKYSKVHEIAINVINLHPAHPGQPSYLSWCKHSKLQTGNLYRDLRAVAEISQITKVSRLGHRWWWACDDAACCIALWGLFRLFDCPCKFKLIYLAVLTWRKPHRFTSWKERHMLELGILSYLSSKFIFEADRCTLAPNAPRRWIRAASAAYMAMW